MINVILLGAAYLFVAVGLENGVFPLLGETFGVVNWGEVRVVAVGVILAGCIRGDAQGLGYALICAIVAGAVPGPGHVGPTLVSFGVAAFGASLVSRWFFVDRFGVRLVNFYILLVLESLIRTGVYSALWGGTGPQVDWITQVMTALVAAGVYGPLKHTLGERSLTTRGVGRSTLSRGR